MNGPDATREQSREVHTYVTALLAARFFLWLRCAVLVGELAQPMVWRLAAWAAALLAFLPLRFLAISLLTEACVLVVLLVSVAGLLDALPVWWWVALGVAWLVNTAYAAKTRASRMAS